MLREEMMK